MIDPRRAARMQVIHTCVFVLLALPSVVLAQERSCPDGRAPAGDLGIRAVRCVGPSASCSISVEGEDGVRRHVFAVEPIVDAVTASPAGADGLRRGDILVAIDGRLITTRDGGRYLANLPVDRSVTLVVRRDGKLRELKIRTVEGCGIRSLSVTTGAG